MRCPSALISLDIPAFAAIRLYFPSLLPLVYVENIGTVLEYLAMCLAIFFLFLFFPFLLPTAMPDFDHRIMHMIVISTLLEHAVQGQSDARG